ncbi:acyltransferase [Maritimibacter sp. 55A14]|nr:lysophospholipid acyltransferase family protein [Maritimibacter sp. 55A14]PWE32537.1 acyltransferase [Maritimibacter sp. 55A14]
MEAAGYEPYDGRNLSYAGTFTNPLKANAIRVIEWLTGKITLLSLVRKFERTGRKPGQSFWRKAIDLLEIELLTPQEQIRRIPETGPVVVVANHPHGLVDGMILAELVGTVRQDFKILTRSLLTNVPEIQYHMLPVSFPHEPDAVRMNIEMRKRAMEHLADGGVIILFPAGQVATSPGWFDDAVEPDWLPFTAKMILKSDAKIVPIFFPGQNSRWFQIANKLSLTVRQGLLLHEIVHAMKKPQKPVIGEALDRDSVKAWQGNPRGFMAHLREHTLGLRETGG